MVSEAVLVPRGLTARVALLPLAPDMITFRYARFGR